MTSITDKDTNETILMLANDRDALREENKTLRETILSKDETILMLASDRDALREEVASIRKGTGQ